MRSILAYSLTRILLFAAALAVCYLAGARGLLLLVLAAVISGLVSFVMLSRQRDRMSAAVAGRVRELRQRIDEGARAEDDPDAGDTARETP